MTEGWWRLTKTQCFLCDPDPTLRVLDTKNLFAMVGHGPLTSRYFVIASKEHTPSFADAFNLEGAIASELALIRAQLTLPDLPLLVAEHGRVPVCRDDKDDHEPHCFHAHTLVFQSDHLDGATVSSYFGRHATFGNFRDALSFAGNQEHYYLFSPSNEQIDVFTVALNTPRQFFRKIVAQTVGESDLADWRVNPRIEIARKIATRERERLLDGAERR